MLGGIILKVVMLGVPKSYLCLLSVADRFFILSNVMLLVTATS
jgi:hypothetical protein